MTALLDVQEATEQITAAVLADYRRLVEATADGKPVDGKKALATLHHCEKTTADLQADASRLVQRRQWSQQAEAGALARGENAAVLSQLSEARQRKAEELARIEREYSATIQRLESESNRLTNVIATADKAASELRGTCPPALAEELAAVKSERSRAGRRVKDLERAEHDLTNDLHRLRDLDEQTPERGGDLAAVERRLTVTREDLTEARATLERLDLEVERLRERCLEPWPQDCPTLRTIDAE